jgi:hypothetical protein
LIRSHGAYLRLSGAIVGGAALIPLAIAAISYVSRGGFEADASLLNRTRPVGGPPMDAAASVETPSEAPAGTEAPAAVTEAPTSLSRYAAMSSRALLVLIACGIAGLALLVGVKREAIGDFVRFSVDAKQATARADDELRQSKVDPATYHRAATLTYTFDDYVNEYLRRAIGIAAANGIYRDRVPSAFWAVRYFRDAQNEEYLVVVKPDGSLHSIHHTLDEKAPGANLSKEEAQARAEAFLHDQKGVNLTDWNLVDSNTDKKPARTDHSFVWEQKAALDPAPAQVAAGGAHIRMQLQVQGDEVSGYRIFIKIPETWRDVESRRTPAQLAQSFGSAALIGIALIAVLVIFLRNLKSPDVARVPWRGLTTLSVLMLLAGIALYVNRAPQLLMAYPTTWPLSSYYTTLAVFLIFITGVYVAGSVLLLGFAWFFLERAFGPGCVPAWRETGSAYFRDAFCLVLFGSVAVMGLGHLRELFARWPLLRHALGTAVPGNLDLFSPAVGALASSIAAGLVAAGFLGLAAGLIAAYIRPPWMRAALLVLFAVLAATNVASPGSFFREAALQLVTLAALWYGVTRIARFNVLGYVLLAAVITLVSAAVDLLEQPNTYLHSNGYAVLVVAAAIVAWPLLRWQRSG